MKKDTAKLLMSIPKIVKYILLAVIAIVIIVSVIFFSGPHISGNTIKYGLNDIGRLDTAEYYYTHVGTYDESIVLGITIPFTNKSFIYSCDGSITAGIDFESIQVEKKGSKITVSIPKAEIHTSELENETFKLYDEQNNIFNPISVSDLNQSFINIKKDEEESAVANGLLDRANENAKTLIENFINGMVEGEEYEIEFKEL